MSAANGSWLQRSAGAGTTSRWDRSRNGVAARAVAAQPGMDRAAPGDRLDDLRLAGRGRSGGRPGSAPRAARRRAPAGSGGLTDGMRMRSRRVSTSRSWAAPQVAVVDRRGRERGGGHGPLSGRPWAEQGDVVPTHEAGGDDGHDHDRPAAASSAAPRPEPGAGSGSSPPAMYGRLEALGPGTNGPRRVVLDGVRGQRFGGGHASIIAPIERTAQDDLVGQRLVAQAGVDGAHRSVVLVVARSRARSARARWPRRWSPA